MMSHSEELEEIIKDIKGNKAELADIKTELMNATDYAEKSELKKRRDRIEETILTREKLKLILSAADKPGSLPPALYNEGIIGCLILFVLFAAIVIFLCFNFILFCSHLNSVDFLVVI